MYIRNVQTQKCSKTVKGVVPQEQTHLFNTYSTVYK